MNKLNELIVPAGESSTRSYSIHVLVQLTLSSYDVSWLQATINAAAIDRRPGE